MLMLYAIAAFGGYLSGSVPYGLLFAKLFGHGDLRKSGSGNIGATNALRVGGKKLGILTLLFDGLKGALPVLLAMQYTNDVAILTAIFAFLGHLYPVWLGFKGGKGVATGIGIAFGFSWMLGLAICAVWLLVAFVSRYSSLAALVSFTLSPILAACLAGPMRATTMLWIAAMIWMRHSDNIRRLAEGKEGRINLGGTKK